MSVLVTESRAELGLEGEGENEKEVYPERPHKGDCFRWLMTGCCGYGSHCQFNHPPDLAGSIVGAMSGRYGKYPERIGQPLCQHYMRYGYCKFGYACKYHHPRQGTGSSRPATTTTYPIQQGMGFGSYSPVAVNVLGYPLRPGEKECSHYVKTGQCKFGDTCKFHHPQTTTIVPSTAPAPTVSSGHLFLMHFAIYQNVQLPVVLSCLPLRPMSTNKGKDVARGGWAGFPEEKKKKGENVAAAASIQALKLNPWVQPAGRGGSPVTPPSNSRNAIVAGGRGGAIDCNPAPNAIPEFPVEEDIDECAEFPVEEDIDECYNSDEYEYDESLTSYEERKNNKWNCEFFITLDNLTAEQINDPKRDWHCPACKDGTGAIRWYKGLQSLVDHAKKVSRRRRIHRDFAELLEQELRVQGILVVPAGKSYGKWNGLNEEEKDWDIVWPPSVVIMNTQLEMDEKSMWLGMGNKELLDYFGSYQAVRARHSYGCKGHRGMSLLIFEASAVGYIEADRLSKHFEHQGNHRCAWENRRILFTSDGKRQLYGYMATKSDMDLFNEHSKGKLIFTMESYIEKVANQLKRTN